MSYFSSLSKHLLCATVLPNIFRLCSLSSHETCLEHVVTLWIVFRIIYIVYLECGCISIFHVLRILRRLSFRVKRSNGETLLLQLEIFFINIRIEFKNQRVQVSFPQIQVHVYYSFFPVNDMNPRKRQVLLIIINFSSALSLLTMKFKPLFAELSCCWANPNILTRQNKKSLSYLALTRLHVHAGSC